MQFSGTGFKAMMLMSVNRKFSDSNLQLTLKVQKM